MKHCLLTLLLGSLLLLRVQGNTALIEDEFREDILITVPGTEYAWQQVNGVTIKIFDTSGGEPNEFFTFQSIAVGVLEIHNDIAIVSGAFVPDNVYYLFDLSDQSDVKLLNTVVVGTARPSAASGPLLALTDRSTDTTTLVDVTDPLNVANRGTIPAGGVAEFYGTDFIIVTSSINERIDIYDISNPDVPLFVSEINYPRDDADDFSNGVLEFGYRLIISETLLAVPAVRSDGSYSDPRGGLFFYDIATPSNPQLISEILPSDEHEVVSAGNFTSHSTFFFTGEALSNLVSDKIVRLDFSDPTEVTKTVFQIDQTNVGINAIIGNVRDYKEIDDNLIFSSYSTPYRSTLIESQFAAPTLDGKLDDWRLYKSFPRDPEGDIQGAENRLDIRQIFLTNDQNHYYLAYWNQNDVILNNGWMLFINASGQGSQNAFGFPLYGERANYMIRNNSVFEYTGNSTQKWKWRFIGSMETVGNGSVVEFRFPSDYISKPIGAPLRLKFFGDNSFYPNGSQRDIYPDESGWFSYP